MQLLLLRVGPEIRPEGLRFQPSCFQILNLLRHNSFFVLWIKLPEWSPSSASLPGCSEDLSFKFTGIFYFYFISLNGFVYSWVLVTPAILTSSSFYVPKGNSSLILLLFQVALTRVLPTEGPHPAAYVKEWDGLSGEEQQSFGPVLMSRKTVPVERIGARVSKNFKCPEDSDPHPHKTAWVNSRDWLS